MTTDKNYLKKFIKTQVKCVTIKKKILVIFEWHDLYGAGASVLNTTLLLLLTA